MVRLRKIADNYIIIVLILLLSFLPFACKKGYTPRPRGYFRISFPAKTYKHFQSDCKFSFEVPDYSDVLPVKESYAEPCWYNINFSRFNACIYLTYKPLRKDLSAHMEDVRTLAYKHIVKADDIIESPIEIPDKHVYGILYDIKGNTASAVNFYITDSVSGFLSGSLYFNVRPNKDSLAPAIDFFREDIVHLINSFEWK
jgi:gliding motility-associated lipoprotein GldD